MNNHNSGNRMQFRTFASPRVHGGRPIAIGRNHASWFLVFARPEGIRCRRATQCLNFVDKLDATTTGLISSSGNPCFTVGGTTGLRVLDTLKTLRDEAGLPITVLSEDSSKLDKRAVVEVGLRPEELVYACAYCGKWEAEGQIRFFPCSLCDSRCYCSADVSPSSQRQITRFSSISSARPATGIPINSSVNCSPAGTTWRLS